MAYVAGAGSIITLLGVARGAVAIGFFRDIAGKTIRNFSAGGPGNRPLPAFAVFILWPLMGMPVKL